MTVMQAIGWVAWGGVVFLALSFTYGLRRSIRRGAGFTWATAMQALFFTVLSIAFFVATLSKLHLFWLAPLVFLGSIYVCVSGVPILTPILLALTGFYLRVVSIGTGMHLARPQDDRQAIAESKKPPLN